MTLPHFKPDDFFQFLKSKGCTLYSDEYVDENIIVYEKDGIKVPLQIQKTYWFLYVVKICNSFKIEPPEDHLKVYIQLMNMPKTIKKEERE